MPANARALASLGRWSRSTAIKSPTNDEVMFFCLVVLSLPGFSCADNTPYETGVLIWHSAFIPNGGSSPEKMYSATDTVVECFITMQEHV